MELKGYEPFLKGSLGWTKMKCGNLRCKCARGELHTACYLSYRLGNKTSTVHIPKALAKKVEQACRNWRKVKKTMETHTHQTITKWLRQYRQERLMIEGKVGSGTRLLDPRGITSSRSSPDHRKGSRTL